jgi:hypothetical protein
MSAEINKTKLGRIWAVSVAVDLFSESPAKMSSHSTYIRTTYPGRSLDVLPKSKSGIMEGRGAKTSGTRVRTNLRFLRFALRGESPKQDESHCESRSYGIEAHISSAVYFISDALDAGCSYSSPSR